MIGLIDISTRVVERLAPVVYVLWCQISKTQPKPVVPKPTPCSDREQAIASSLDPVAVFHRLSDHQFSDSINELIPKHRHRLYPPLDTLSLFVVQALSADRSCQHVVNQRIAWALEHDLPVPSSSTTAYCQARTRLPLELVKTLCQSVAIQACAKGFEPWSWNKRRVLLIDGTGVSMPDTADNQKHYPQPSSQKPGLGFPQARVSTLVCATSAAIIDAEIGPFHGKNSGELSHMRTLSRSLQPNDILVGDAIYETFWTFYRLQCKHCDGVFEINGSRSYKRGKRERLIEIKRPAQCPEWMSVEQFSQVPKTLTVRQVRCRKPGCQDRMLISSLTDSHQVDADQIIELYERRWSVETDLRSLKCDLGADVLSCRTRDMVDKELWVHLLAYNLVRLTAVEAALDHQCPPRHISFRHTVQLWLSGIVSRVRLTAKGWKDYLSVVASQRVGARPGRKEPRAIKRRPKARKLLDLPRPIARQFRYRYEQ